MRVLLAHNYYQRRGGEDAVYENEAGLLEAHGHVVIRHAVSNASIESLTDKARTIVHATWNRAARRDIASVIERERPDVLHVHNFFPLLSPAIYDAARQLGVPVVQTLHNYRLGCASGTFNRDGETCERCLGRLPLPAIRYRCYRDSTVASAAVAGMIAIHRARGTWATKVDRFITLTEFQRSKMIAAGLPPERIVVKPNFVEDPGEVPSADRHGALFVGRLMQEKGAGRLVEAWVAMDASLTVAGSGPLEATIRRAALPSVAVLGQIGRAELAALYRRASFIVLPSLSYEAMPITLLEAWSNGLPAISFRHSAFGEMIEDGVNGLLAPPGDFAALMEKVRWAVANPDAMAGMGRAARRRYQQRFTPDANYGMLMSVYREAQAHAGRTVAGSAANERRSRAVSRAIEPP